jgi:ATP-dependent helicase/DNAse subunit B
MILDDSISISAMNKDYIPVKFKKNGEVDARTGKYLYTYDGWEELGEKISNKIGEVTSEMKGGNISLTTKTKDSPCDYCSFKPICRK